MIPTCKLANLLHLLIDHQNAPTKNEEHLESFLTLTHDEVARHEDSITQLLNHVRVFSWYLSYRRVALALVRRPNS